MRRIFLAFFAIPATVLTGFAQPVTGNNRHTGKMQLLSPYYTFTANGDVQGHLNSDTAKGTLVKGDRPGDSFTIRLLANLQPFSGEQNLLTIPDLVTLQLRQADPSDRNRQNYPAATLSDGSVPVLEASIELTAPFTKLFNRVLTIGFPLAALPAPWGKHELVLNFTGVRWTIYCDGRLMDNDFAIGYPNFGQDNDWEINKALVNDASISFPAATAVRTTAGPELPPPDVQYWTPGWHNAWVGDVATLYYKGRYHVFYLFDRRHHASKFGVGGHYFEHFSTADFRTWTEHEAAVPIEAQWETIGTGTPFVWQDQLRIAYGLHTSRIFPDSLTMTVAQKDYFTQNGKTGGFAFDLKKAFPAGASYSTSSNGLDDFHKSNQLFHYCENPSVYIDPDGKLKMIANFRAKGTWTSTSLDSNWTNLNPDFPNGGDCTFFFRWGKFDYIIGGFVNLWMKPATAGEEGWVDMVKVGRDFYNGINVPAVTRIQDGRYLMAGWFPITGWGGPFVVHELIQQPDGRIRTKWMPELIPDTRDTVLLAPAVNQPVSFPVQAPSFILSFEVHPGKKQSGKLAVSFLPSSKAGFTNAAVMQIDTKARTAQYSNALQDGFAAPEASLRNDGSPQSVGNYAIEQLTGMDKPYTVRILVKSNSKLGGTILDTEIAGQNTMISYRRDFSISSIAFQLDDASLRNVKLMKVVE